MDTRLSPNAIIEDHRHFINRHFINRHFFIYVKCIYAFSHLHFSSFWIWFDLQTVFCDHRFTRQNIPIRSLSLIQQFFFFFFTLNRILRGDFCANTLNFLLEEKLYDQEESRVQIVFAIERLRTTAKLNSRIPLWNCRSVSNVRHWRICTSPLTSDFNSNWSDSERAKRFFCRALFLPRSIRCMWEPIVCENLRH